MVELNAGWEALSTSLAASTWFLPSRVLVVEWSKMLTVNLTVQRNPNGHQELYKALWTSPIFWVSSFRISPLASILPNFMPPPITNQEQKNTTTQKQKHATQLPSSREVTEAVLQVSYGLFSLQKFCIEVIQRRHQGPLVLKTFERNESWRIVWKKRIVLVSVIEIHDFYWFLNFRIIMITYIRHLWQKEMRLVADMILKLITYEDISHLLTACTFWSVIFPIVWVGQCSLYPFACLRKGCTLLEIQNL